MQEASLKAILASVKCPLCSNVLKHPTSTKCGHTFCYDCISIKSAFHCPICYEILYDNELSFNAQLNLSLMSLFPNNSHQCSSKAKTKRSYKESISTDDDDLYDKFNTLYLKRKRFKYK